MQLASSNLTHRPDFTLHPAPLRPCRVALLSRSYCAHAQDEQVKVGRKRDAQMPPASSSLLTADILFIDRALLYQFSVTLRYWCTDMLGMQNKNYDWR
mmetsp:Transcript_41700/g.107782  ORF Transcript_41700/g.107782 Transcript_41700/m.107782 type:complete len:98 (-) Transcript_41700:352-645(-)